MPAVLVLTALDINRTSYHFTNRSVLLDELTVKDNIGLTAKDAMQVIVDDLRTNHLPMANAGGDQIITLPANTIALNGTGSIDPENKITS